VLILALKLNFSTHSSSKCVLVMNYFNSNWWDILQFRTWFVVAGQVIHVNTPWELELVSLFSVHVQVSTITFKAFKVFKRWNSVFYSPHKICQVAFFLTKWSSKSIRSLPSFNLNGKKVEKVFFLTTTAKKNHKI